MLTWLNRLIRDPRILDPVERILGLHLSCWSSRFLRRSPRSRFGRPASGFALAGIVETGCRSRMARLHAQPCRQRMHAGNSAKPHRQSVAAQGHRRTKQPADRASVCHPLPSGLRKAAERQSLQRHGAKMNTGTSSAPGRLRSRRRGLPRAGYGKSRRILYGTGPST